MTTFQLEVAILVVIGGGLTLYWLLGGADFGGGVWDLMAVGPMRERERALISDAIGPVSVSYTHLTLPTNSRV